MDFMKRSGEEKSNISEPIKSLSFFFRGINWSNTVQIFITPIMGD
jgi:hypothetical protein